MTNHQLSRFTLAVGWTLLTALSSTPAAQSSRSSVETARIFEALGVTAGQTIGEIGAGNGELSMAAAKAVGDSGRVLTSELGDSRVQSLEAAVKKSGLSRVQVVAGDANKTNFADGCCDAIFMRNVYHHFADPAAMNASIFRSLKPGGRVAVVDFEPNRGRPEAAKPSDRSRDESHGVTPGSVARELREAGFEITINEPAADRWFMVVASKPR
jgi:ubiquinone/menaquinone biosynthesis C-methylase UbiE